MPLTKVSDVMLDSGGTGLPLNIKGQLVVHDELGQNVPLDPPNEGQVLVGNPSAPEGMSWQEPASIPSAGGRLVGEIIMGGFAAAPAQWLACDGAAVSRSTYDLLHAAIGETFGVGDGVLTFNVPDLRSRSPMAPGTGFYRLQIAGINVSSNVLTVPSSDIQTGTAVVYTTTGPNPPATLTLGLPFLVSGDTYYWIREPTSTTTGKLAQSRALAIEGTPINLQTVGDGIQTLQVNLTARTMGQIAGEENHTLTVAELAPHQHNNGYPPTGGAAGTDTGRGFGATAPAGGGLEHNTVHPVAVVGFFIYAGV